MEGGRGLFRSFPESIAENYDITQPVQAVQVVRAVQAVRAVPVS